MTFFMGAFLNGEAWTFYAVTRDDEGVVYVADFGGNLTSFSIRS